MSLQPTAIAVGPDNRLSPHKRQVPEEAPPRTATAKAQAIAISRHRILRRSPRDESGSHNSHSYRSGL